MAFRPNLERKEEKERVRAALLRAALHLGASHGFSSVGLREVAREAGIAPTSFYRHFADMEELGMALVRELVGHSLRGVGELARVAERGALVTTLVDAMLKAAQRDSELLRFVASERVGSFGGLRTLLRGELSTLAELVQRAGGEHVPLMAAEAIVTLLVDGAIRALDAGASATEAVRDGLSWTITRLLEVPHE
ncbi:MAG: TetR family transcriptional regulator [Polyangiales bacterium]